MKYLNCFILCLYLRNIFYCDKIKATIIPYRPRASPKINISIIPTNSLSCCPKALAAASPDIPIAKPAAYFN